MLKNNPDNETPSRDVLAQTAVRVAGLEKHFASLPVLKGVTFDVQCGQTLSIEGPSGSGKSTLLHVLGLLTTPSKGEVFLFGRSFSDRKPKEWADFRNRHIGFLFQFHHLLPDLTLLENAQMPLFIRGASRQEALSRALPLMERLGLTNRMHHLPSESSGGEQQRASLARALVGEPRLILADEPTGNLDRQTGREVEQLLLEEVSRRGAALILVTHNREMASHMNRHFVLREGRLEEED